MMCFSVQKLKKRFDGVEQTANIEGSTASVEVDEAMSPPASPAFLSARKSFRSRVRAIQNAQRFLTCNPRLRSSHPSYGSRDGNSKRIPDSGLLLLPLGGRARSASELGSSQLDVASAYQTPLIDQTSTNGPSPQPLPSPRLAPQPLNAYRLPLPSESANTTSLNSSPPRLVSPRISKTDTYMQTTTVLPSSSSSSSTVAFIQVHNGNNPALSSTITSSMHAGQSQIGNNPVLSSNSIIAMAWAKGSEPELQPLPPPKEPVTASALKCFRYDELASACQNFSPDRCFDAAGACFYGAIKVKVNGKANKRQDVVVVRLKERQQQVVANFFKIRSFFNSFRWVVYNFLELMLASVYYALLFV